jgi:drug/metabolite transporter (DMT)-like permease
MNEHVKGLALTAIGVLFIVPDSLFVRLIDASPITISFWRNLVAGVLILSFVLLMDGPRAVTSLRSTGRAGLAYVVLFGIASISFVMAVSHTSVANVVFILAAMPVFAALFSRLFLAEPLSTRMMLTMLGVFMGLGIILRGSHETAGAHWTGDLMALAVAACFAGALTAVRSLRARSMLPAIPISLIGTAVLMAPFADIAGSFLSQWPLLLGHGFFIAVAASLMTLGPRYISSAEVSLLILLESVLAPILVWAALGEDPGIWALIGGAVVLAVLLVSNLWVLMRYRRVQSSSR